MGDDTISRKAAIDVLGKIFPADPMRNDYTKGITCGAALATEYIKQLPTAEHKGHWIMLAHRKAKCSSCGVVEYTNGIDLTMSGCIFYATKPYCPHCGARMEIENGRPD